MSKSQLIVNLWVAGSTDPEHNGGWCTNMHCIIDGQHHTNIIGGHAIGTTPTRMSLLGVLNGLLQLRRDKPMYINIYTSVVQVSSGLNTNMHKWANRNWLTTKDEPPQHLDLWQHIYFLLTDRSRVMGYKVILQNKDNMDHPNRLVAIHHAAEYMAKGKQHMYEVSLA
ncbi:hypothetical protein [Escherichia coli]|uniref:hypothetical protein n=1 Tax=Escherichia coli TaxID=562 RepID=UPI0002A1CCE6|nr:hypothetical protein [Escherichia coli]ELC54482.1 hypothetical protein WGI_05103 [Escherichia coli KTE44]